MVGMFSFPNPFLGGQLFLPKKRAFSIFILFKQRGPWVGTPLFPEEQFFSRVDLERGFPPQLKVANLNLISTSYKILYFPLFWASSKFPLLGTGDNVWGTEFSSQDSSQNYFQGPGLSLEPGVLRRGTFSKILCMVGGTKWFHKKPRGGPQKDYSGPNKGHTPGNPQNPEGGNTTHGIGSRPQQKHMFRGVYPPGCAK